MAPRRAFVPWNRRSCCTRSPSRIVVDGGTEGPVVQVQLLDPRNTVGSVAATSSRSSCWARTSLLGSCVVHTVRRSPVWVDSSCCNCDDHDRRRDGMERRRQWGRQGHENDMDEVVEQNERRSDAVVG